MDVTAYQPLELYHLRWNVPVLGAFEQLRGQAKFVTLQRRLGISRSSLQRTLRALIDARLVRKNEGYGHPLRPEYLLTEAGRGAGEPADRLMRRLEQLDIVDVGLRKWSIPAAQAISDTDGRFNRLQEALAGITPRALARTLVDLEGAGWIERRLLDERRPRPLYVLAPSGRSVTRLAADLQQRLAA